MNSPDMPKRFLDTTALETLRKTTNWETVCQVLRLERDDKRSKGNDWWMRSPFSEDTTPSFHIKPGDGIWYCFSTRQGGGVIELVQKLEGLNCFDAGEWLIDTGCAPEPDGVHISGERKRELPREVEKSANAPVKQSLLPNLSEHGTHEEFTRRGIDEKTCHYLGCGYLAKGRSRLKDRIVFQVRGVEETDEGLQSTILTHVGRATTPEQIGAGGKWLTYKGFRKSAELYNIDKLLLDPVARDQVRKTGQVLIVEGPFDVAMLVEAGICNVVATMGSDLSLELAPRLKLLSKQLDNPEFVLWYDRDKAGRDGQAKAIETLQELELKAYGFDWDARFGVEQIPIPDAIQDPCDLSVQQIKWLRAKGIV
jgi:DNA primase